LPTERRACDRKEEELSRLRFDIPQLLEEQSQRSFPFFRCFVTAFSNLTPNPLDEPAPDLGGWRPCLRATQGARKRTFPTTPAVPEHGVFSSGERERRTESWFSRRLVHHSACGLAESTHKVAEIGTCDPDHDGLQGLRKVLGKHPTVCRRRPPAGGLMNWNLGKRRKSDKIAI
jgi:hypothetical protein